MTKTLIPSILFIIVTVIALFAFSKEAPNSEELTESAQTKTTPSGIVLFYGIGCPYCEQVDAYITEQDITEKVSFERKEVYYNKENADELASLVSICGLPTNKVGVPFLWDGEYCFVGMPDIVNFFDEKVTENTND